MAIRPISLLEAQYLAHELACRLMDYDEPMPPFETRYIGKLEACISAPFQTYDSRQLYHYFWQKASVLFYGVIKDHPFINGNKRMAVMLTLAFYYVNGRWVNTPPDDLYRLACSVAESHPSRRGDVIAVLNTMFRKAETPLRLP